MIYWQLLWVYLKIGVFGFGGGYAMLSLIQYEVVDKYQWLTLQEFTDVVAISQMTPGPIGINSATYIGYTATGSVWGSVIATFAVCLPSFLLVLLISYFFAKFKSNKYVAAAFIGLRPMTVGLIAAAALLLMNKENFVDYKSILIFMGAFFLTWKYKIHPILMILIAGVVGLILGSCDKPKETQIRLATFNVRYDNPEDSLNNWKYRKDSVCAFIHRNELDIVDMQEVLHNQMADLQKCLTAYSSVGVGRDDGKTAGEYAPIFFLKDKFTLLDQNTFWLSEYPDSVGLKGWDAVCTRIATWAKLREKSSGQVFMVVNTHFDHVGTKARRNSALLIIRKIKEIVGDQPAILTGDFNVSEKWEAYKTITEDSTVLKDAYKIAEKRSGVNYTFHNFGKIPAEKCEKIDFIFVTPQIQVLSSDIPFSRLNDSLYLSDHNPEIVELQINQK